MCDMTSAVCSLLFDDETEESKKLIGEAAKASVHAMDKIILEKGMCGNKKKLTKRMFSAAVKASAKVLANALEVTADEENSQKELVQDTKSTEDYSPELQKMITEMNKTAIQHNYVYPPKPKPGDILIPTGGLAKCQCSPGCAMELMEPAYQVIDGEKKSRWVPDNDDELNTILNDVFKIKNKAAARVYIKERCLK
ncbi:unnamed protein product [Caenorhabditis sp. 36 PRJEB53466]|nr:unnamed protein product [Caenorhabditis sp. 36 PRJEB53466]